MAKTDTFRFEMPFRLTPPVITDQAIGISSVVLRDSGEEASHITVLDTADERLLRAGVVLAHRVKGSLGDWYLHAPAWQPWLPVNKSLRLDAEGDLPDEYADLVRPFRRHAPLGPVASVTRHAGRYELRDAERNRIGLLLDERITIRRGAIAVGRHRQATFRAVATNDEQRDRVLDRLAGAGGVRVEQFPDWFDRLGGPRLGLSDYPEPRAVGRDVRLEALAANVFATGLRKIVLADLAIRSGRVADTKTLQAELGAVLGDLHGFDGLIDRAWADRLEARLGELVTTVRTGSPNGLGEAYLDALDALVGAARAPRLGRFGDTSAKTVLKKRILSSVSDVQGACKALDDRSPDSAWVQAERAARQALGQARIARGLFTKPIVRLKPLRNIVRLLGAAQSPGSGATPDLSGLSVEQAFDAGRRWQAQLANLDAARHDFLVAWPRLASHLPKQKG